MSTTPTILIIEDSKFFASMISREIQKRLGFKVEWKSTFSDAKAAIERSKDNFLVAVLDVNLPDAPNGEAVDYALNVGIPSIVFTGTLNAKMRDQFLSWNLVDYILKEARSSVETLITTIGRIHKNKYIKILVVDDSSTMRATFSQLLKAQQYYVLEARDGIHALKVLEESPDIKLVITDYNMPQMNGLELIQTIRAKRSKNRLAIIGISASDDNLLSAKLIKAGANDFLFKPFQVEEFNCRVNNAIEMLENIKLIRDLSYKDPLTKLYNRRYFFENAVSFIKRTTQKGKLYCVAMLDIDFFKKVNDTYGHDGGDIVLKNVSTLLAEHFATDAIVSRFGGEEFCVLTAHDPDDDVIKHFDDFRQAIEASSVESDGKIIQVTVSIGVCYESYDLDAMLKLADNRLYTAKETGRNKVVASRPSPNIRG